MKTRNEMIKDLLEFDPWACDGLEWEYISDEEIQAEHELYLGKNNKS